MDKEFKINDVGFLYLSGNLLLEKQGQYYYLLPELADQIVFSKWLFQQEFNLSDSDLEVLKNKLRELYISLEVVDDGENLLLRRLV